MLSAGKTDNQSLTDKSHIKADSIEWFYYYSEFRFLAVKSSDPSGVIDLYSCQSVSIALHLVQRGALSFQFDEVTEASAVGSVGDFCVCTVGGGEQIAHPQHRTRNRS